MSSLSTGESLVINFLDVATEHYCAEVNLTRVSLISNEYFGDIGGAVYIQFGTGVYENFIKFEECNLYNNTSGRGAASYIQDNFTIDKSML